MINQCKNMFRSVLYLGGKMCINMQSLPYLGWSDFARRSTNCLQLYIKLTDFQNLQIY